MITGDMSIKDVKKLHPESRKVFGYYHLNSIGCGWGGGCNYTIEQVAQMKKIDANEILEKLNNSLKG